MKIRIRVLTKHGIQLDYNLRKTCVRLAPFELGLKSTCTLQ